MSEEKIGSLRRVRLDEVWPHEALNFTTWLEENIDVLADAIDLPLSVVEREQRAGDFRVDLVAKDESGKLVIIENQFRRSDHDHLGKLITYLTKIGAKTAIWIVEEPRTEHVGAISWLNESSPASFYLLKLEAVRIEDSPPAPLLTPIVGPIKESQEVDEKEEVPGERDSLRHRFWTWLLEQAKEKTPLHANTSPNSSHCIKVRIGKGAFYFRYLIQRYTSDIELYIDRGKGTKNENEKLFETLRKSKEDIEKIFGEALEWQGLEDQRSCRIGKRFTRGGYRDDEEKWAKIQEAMIDGMIRLEKAFRPHIDRLSE